MNEWDKVGDKKSINQEQKTTQKERMRELINEKIERLKKSNEWKRER